MKWYGKKTDDKQGFLLDWEFDIHKYSWYVRT